MNREVVTAKDAPRAIGPYSQGIRIGNLVFVSGQIAIDPKTGEFTDSDIEDQAKLVLKNISAVLEAGNSSLDMLAKITVYLIDMSDFTAVNDVFERCFIEQPPARETVQVAGLPKGAKIEVSAIGLIKT